MSLEEEQGFYKLPDKIVLMIFQYLKNSQDLCQIEQVCKRFREVAIDTWKSHYQKIFEYKSPLFKLGQCKFKFISPDKCTYKNPWKESFKQLYQGVHVRPGFQHLTFRDNNLQYFDKISDALDYVKKENEKDSSFQSLIFLHAGTYKLDCYTIHIENNVALIGAAPGENVEKSVIIKGTGDIMFTSAYVERAYVGYLTLELTSYWNEEIWSNCLVICGNPTIDHCIIRSIAPDHAAVYVSDAANPLIKNCDISHCKNVGLFIHDEGSGIYEDNTISCNAKDGINIEYGSQVIMRRNKIYQNRAGIYICAGSGLFEDNEVYNNKIGFDIKYSPNIIIQRNKIFNKKNQNHTQKIGVSFCYHSCGLLKDNEICDHSYYGVQIRHFSNPVIRGNTINSNKVGVSVSNKGSGLLKHNYISNSATNNIEITNHSRPTLKWNHIFRGRDHGIYIYDKSAGILIANVIFENTQMGVLISSKSHPILNKNFIFGNMAAGVQIDNNATATLNFNKIVYNRSKGLCLASEVSRQSFLTGKKNKICYNGNKKQRMKRKIVSSSKSAKIINL